jgi:hypothetical protein
MNGRRIDLSATQVIASMLAAVTGAVAASYLGVAGTVVGAAVMSVASTVVASVYKHYLARSRERLRAAREAARIAPQAGGHFLPHDAATGPGQDTSQAATRTDLSRAATRADLSRAATRPDGSRAATRADLSRAATRPDGSRAATRADRSRAAAQPDRSRATAQPVRAAGPDDVTQIMPAVAFGPHRWDGADRANGLDGLADGATQIVSRPGYGGVGAGPDNGARSPARPDPGDGDAGRGESPDGPGSGPAREPGGPGAGDDGAGDDGAGDDGAGGPRDARWRRPRPLVLAGIALGVFLLAMAGITAFEAVAGKPLDAIVGSGHGSGTTVGSIVGGSGHQTGPRHTGPARPSRGTSPTPRPSTSPAPSPTPTPTPTPSPTPSGSPGASPATSPSAPASPAQAPASPAQAPASPASGAEP